MGARTIRIVIELSESDFEELEEAAERAGTQVSEYARHAALRRAEQDVGLRTPHSPSEAPKPPPPRRHLRPVVHRAAMPTREIVRQLEQHLGAQLLAITAGTKPEEVARWASQEDAPSPVHECRLREAHEVWQLVISVESKETTRAWWMGMKDQLDDLSPAEAIALDRAQVVMSVARSFVESG